MKPAIRVTSRRRFQGGAWPALVAATLVLTALAGAGPGLYAQGSPADGLPDRNSLIDVAVFYTPSAMAVLGGRAATEAEIDLMVAETNRAFAESGATQRIALVAARRVQYTEFVPIAETFLGGPIRVNPARTYSNALSHFVDADDGYIDGVHAVRDEVGADICILLIGEQPYAYFDATRAGGPGGAFAVNGALSGGAVFAHQIGHLQGLWHDRYEACAAGGVCPDGADGYGYGYVNQRAFEPGAPESSRWRTIMARNIQCEVAGFDCELLLRFSNPDRIYPDPGGDPMGVPRTVSAPGRLGPANAVRRLNETFPRVRDFRNGPAGPTVSISAAVPSVTEGMAAVFTITLSEPAPETMPLTVRVTEDGSVLSGTPPRTVTIPAGLATATLLAHTENDTAAEFAGRVTARLIDGYGYTVGRRSRASVRVDDDDARVAVNEPPARLGAPAVQDRGYHALSVSWAESGPADPRTTGHDLQYRKSTDADWTDGPQDQTGTSARISGLEGDTNYQVRVRARNRGVAAPWSEPGEGATALWVGALTVGSDGPDSNGHLGYQQTSAGRFGDLSPKVVTYNGVEYQFTLLGWSRRHRIHGNGESHNSAIDVYMTRRLIPNGWVLRVHESQFPASEGYRSNFAWNWKKIYWVHADVSLALGRKYEVALSRESSAEKDPNFDPAAGLTAEFNNLPGAHDGATPFSFRLQFSEEVNISRQALASDVFELSGGTVAGVRQLSSLRNAVWEISVRPSGNGPVSIAIPANRPCGTAGAICTISGKSLSRATAETVLGPVSPVLPSATIAPVASPVTEGTPATFTVTLGNAAPRALTVPVIVTESGSMLSGSPPVSVAFAEGETTATLSVPTSADSVVEPDSTVTATVTPGEGRSVSAAVTVEDDDAAAFTVSADPASIEEGRSSTLTVAISNGVTYSEAQPIALAVSGTASDSDYSGVPLALTLPAGASSVSTTLRAEVDHGAEEPETVTVTASLGGAPIGSATVTINSLSHDASLSALGLSGVDIGTFSATTTSYEPSVPHWVESTTVTATATHPSATVSLEPGAEVLLSEGTNGIAVTVTAEDGVTKITYIVNVTRESLPRASVVAGPSPVAEGAAATFAVTLDKPTSEALTVAVSVTENGSALAGSPPASVTFPQGQTSVELSEPTEEDAVVEVDSTVTATVMAGTGYHVGRSSSASVTVEDDDARRVPTAPPARPGAPTVQENGLEAVLVSWSEPDPPDPRITGYDVRYRKSTEEEWTDGPQDTTETNLEITGLDGDTLYLVQVRAQNTVYEGPWSEPGEGTTALWTGTLTVGRLNSGANGFWGFQSSRGMRFGEISPRVISYGGVDYPIRILAWYRGRRAHGTSFHRSAIDFYTTEHAIPDEWILRIHRSRFLTSDGHRARLDPDAEKVFWTEPDISLSLGESYEVALSRQPSAEKDENFNFDPTAPLTAELEGVPRTHNGSAQFSFRVRFSEEVRVSIAAFGNGLPEVAGGRVLGARRVHPQSNAFWEVSVQPDGDGSVSIAIPANRECGTAGAVCSVTGKMLSRSVGKTVLGPVSQALPVATIGPVASPVTEGTAAAFEVSLDKAASEPVAIAVATTESGSMLSGTPPTSVTIAAGQTSGTLTVPTGGDSVVEAASTITATVTAGAGYTIGAAGSAAVTVDDDDEARFTVAADPEAISEGESATLTVAISNGVTFAKSQKIALAVSGTASASDYTRVPAALTLASGASSVMAELVASEDEEEEEPETLTVTASHGGSAIGSASVTINSISHDATLASLSLSGIDIGTFDPALTSYEATVGPAVESAAVTARPSHPGATVSIDPGPEASLSEGPNRIAVTVTAEDGTTTRTYTVTVTRRSDPEVSIAAGSSPVTEGAAAVFTVTLDAAATEALTIAVSVTESGTALAGSPPASVTFAAGETTAALTLPTAGDSVVEAASTVTATVTPRAGYTVGAPASAAVRVDDDDEAQFTVAADPEAISEGESATLTVAISNEVTFLEDQTIALATSGTASASDYSGVPAALTLASGASSVTAELAASRDEEEEEPETVTVTASHGGSAIGSASVTINSKSHDAALASLSLSGIDIGAFSGTVTSYTANVGHAVETTTVTATARHAGATVTVDPGAEAALAEGPNEIVVRVTAEDGVTTRTYTVTVTRAGLPVVSVVAVAERVPEGEQVKFRLSRTGPATDRLSVGLRWSEGEGTIGDIQHSHFPTGTTTKTPTYHRGDDKVVGEDRVVTLTVEDGEGYTVSEEARTARVVLEENDEAQFALSAEPGEVVEGEAAVLTLEVTNGVTFAEDQAISLAVSGTASASDYTGVPAALTLASGASSVTAELAASEDEEEEGPETVTVTASLGGTAIGSATVTINSISHDAALASLSLSGIDIGTFSDTVTSYTANVGRAVETTTVTATARHAGATVTVDPGAEAALAEGPNEIVVRVTAEDGVTTQTYTVTVTRASLPVVSVVAVTERVPEGERVEFRLSRTGPATDRLSVGLRWSDGERTTGDVRQSHFPIGTTTKTPTYHRGGDKVVGEDRVVTLTVEDGEGYTVSEEARTARVVLAESDEAAFALSAEPGEVVEGEAAVLTLAITNGVTFAEDQAISLAVSGTASASDYTGVPAALTLASGASSVTAELVASEDEEEEGPETVTVTASLGGTAIGPATVTINSISHDATLASLSLSGIDIGAFSGTVTSYTANVGHAVETTTVTATARHAGATVTVDPGAEAALAEGPNEIVVRVTAEDGVTTRTYTVTVTRAGLPVVSVEAIEERVTGPFGAVRVTRAGPTEEPLEVQLRLETSRSSGAEVVTALFQRGADSVTKRIQAGDNLLVEDDITVTWTIQPGEGYTVSAERASASVVLEESEVPEFSVTVQPASIAEGEQATVRVEITNRVRFSRDQTIALNLAGGTAVKGEDYTISSEAVQLSAHVSWATATLTALADGSGEEPETVAIAASHDGREIGSATLTIQDTRPEAPLTAELAGVPAKHDGETAFRFELRFSEEIEIGFAAVRDSVFEVTGGSVTGARRLVPGSNRRWEITAEPAADADVALAVPPTTDCTAAGAVCTAGGRRLSARVAATVKGPGSEPAGGGFPLAAANSRPSGIWSDGQTAWVADLDDARLYAYRRSDGEREPEKDIATGPGPMGLWSDGETLWVAGLGGGLRAHRLADGTRQAWRDLALEANAAPAGIWSDGDTLWAADWLGAAVHAYHLPDGRREPGRDIRLSSGNLMPVGLWSDGETLWVADWRERVYAYRLADGGRAARRDIEAAGGDTDPTGLWSGGETLLATGWESGEVRAYRLRAAVEGARAKKRSDGPTARAISLPTIPDPALQAAIGAALDKARGETVSPQELAGLEALAARNAGIRDLSGLEQALGLKELDLGFNPVLDLRPLAALPALESLNLDGSALDLAPLASMTGLRRLSVRHNSIDDLQALAQLAGLAELDLGDNRIQNLGPLVGLTGLAVLRADRNLVEDLWPLASLTGLEALDLRGNRVQNLQPVAALARLQSLRLGGNGLAELYPLSGLMGLTDLDLSGNAVESLRALTGMHGLRRLDLRGTFVEDLRPLTGLSSLAWVHVGGSRIEDLTPLDGLDGLTVAGGDDLESPSVGDGRGGRSGTVGFDAAGR